MSTPARGWCAPARPGPARRTALLLLGGTLLAATVWALIATGVLVDAVLDERRPTRLTLDVELDGRVDARVSGGGTGDAEVGRPRSEIRSSGSAGFQVTRLRVAPPEGRGLRVRVALPPGADDATATLRVIPQGGGGVVTRGEDGTPKARVEPRQVGEHVDLLLVVPLSSLEIPAMQRDAGSLASVTRPLDEAIEQRRHAMERFRSFREGWWWLAPLAALVAAGGPLFGWWLARRRFFSLPPLPRQPKDPPVRPPSSLPAVTAGALTRGAAGIAQADAYAAQVLELVDSERLRMRRAAHPGYGTGVMVGVAGVLVGVTAEAAEAGAEVEVPVPSRVDAAPEPTRLGAAAIALLLATSPASMQGGALHVPDSKRQMEQLLAKVASTPALHEARAGWKAALREHLDEQGLVQRAPARLVAAGALAAAALSVACAVIATTADLAGARATWWLGFVAAAALTAVQVAQWRDVRRWRRVRHRHAAARVRWLAWRAVLGATGRDVPLDLRNLPYAAATGDVKGIAPSVAAIDDVGLAAVTTGTVRSLRMVAGARG